MGCADKRTCCRGDCSCVCLIWYGLQLVQDCALRYEPAGASGEEAVPGIAAALLVGGLHTHINPADPALVRHLL